MFETIERANDGADITVFEVMTAAAFALFAAAPADLCILEVGLGGRGDATNVVIPASCAITSISLDHREMLGDTLALIAAEKAGIMKPGIPTVTGEQTAEAMAALERAGPVLRRGRDWWIAPEGSGLRYRDADAELALPMPGLLGRHQIDNAGIAVAAIRAAGLGITDFAGLARASWPARLQRLHGRLAELVPDRELWLDGGHNPGGGEALAAQTGRMGPDASPGRHEAGEGHGGVPPPGCCRTRPACGRWPSRGSIRRFRWRRFAPHLAALPVLDPPSWTRCERWTPRRAAC